MGNKITFLQYCKANPFFYVGMGFVTVLATASFYLGETGGIAAGVFFCIVGIALVLGQVLSYKRL